MESLRDPVRPGVIAPSKARRLLSGESPGRVRASHPPVSRVVPAAERRQSRTNHAGQAYTENPVLEACHVAT
jgi:hypothetical protein